MRYIFILFLFVLTPLCNAQNYTTLQYNMENGLPQNSVKDIVKDKYGFIWITTENNVLRYDGNKLETYKNSGLSNSHLGDFYGSVERDSIIIFGDLHGKKAILKNRELQKFENGKITRNSFNGEGKGFSIFNKTSSEGLYYNNNTDYFIDFEKERYFFTNGNQIDYEKGDIRKTLNIPYVNLRNAFAFNDVLLIRNQEQKKLFAIKKGEFLQIPCPAILLDPESKIHWQQTTDQVFIINNDKLYIGDFRDNNLKFKLLITHNDIKNSYHCIFYDKEYNKIYIGSLTKGLNILSPHNFKNIPEDYVAYSSLPFSSTTFITPNGQELGKNGVRKEYHFPYATGNTFLMMYDENGNILREKTNTLERLLKNKGYQKSEKINFGESVIKILTKVDHYYAVATTETSNYNFLYLYTDTQFLKPAFQFRFTREVTSVCFIDNDHLLVGTTDELYKVSLKNRKIEKIHDKITVKHIIKNNDGTHWITTKSQGFFLFKSSKLIPISPDGDNALLSAHYILEDLQGFWWISSNNGLFKISKNELSNFLKNKKEKPIYYRYDTGNGLLNNELNGGSLPNAFQLENGDFVFPSFNGFLVFTPFEIKSYYPKKGELLVERIRIDNGEIESFNKNISLKSDFEQLEILLDIPYYGNEKNLQLSVKQHYQGEWKDLKQQRKLDVFNLKPGKYKFTFRVYTGFGYDYKTVDLEVVPFFYETKMFYFIITLLAFLSILWIIYFRTKRLSGKNEKLKKQLATESDYQKRLMETISHDITTPLKFISNLSQKILESNDPDVQRQYFDSIHKSSEELYKFTSDMKDYAQLFKNSDSYEIFNVFDIVEEKRLLFYEISRQKNIVILNNIVPFLSIKTKKNMLSVIIHNILDNAIKNSENSKIEIKWYANEVGQATLLISDWGIGMSDDQINHYNALSSTDVDESLNLKNIRLGLNLVIQLIKKLDATILFKKNIPKGTEVQITFKNSSQ